MKYSQKILLKNAAECILRNGTESDGQALLDLFILTHGQTDYLTSYPEETRLDAAAEAAFLKEKAESEHAIELLAIVNGAVVGSAGIEAVGTKYKVRHRAEFGISVAKDFWGLGIGRALTEACIACARQAGYAQLELTVVGDNRAAISLYESVGFREYGRNPKGFRSRISGWQELVLMRLELE